MNAISPVSRSGMARWLGAVLFILIAIMPLHQASAQTASDLSGSIKSEGGTPIAGAEIVITHEPSGTRRTATSGASGNFFQPGLRVGGPYTVSVSAEGYRNAEIEQIFLRPGGQEPLTVRLDSDTADMEEIVVTAEAEVMRDLNRGVGSAFSAEDINNTPATQRDVIRTLLRDPLAQSNGDTGNLSVAGVNPRFNGLAIDGTLQQDDFGLGDSTYATARSPINLDAIESATLVASDYDVSASGFTGGLVNLTTKSGTNDWRGSAFYYFQNDSMIGDTYDGDRTFEPGDIDEKEYGFTFGGPIIKDKLFFFVSYDEFDSADTFDFSNSDANNGREPGFYDALRQVIVDELGYDPGTRPQTANTPITSERALVKLDWNISDLHRASFTYQSTEETGASVGAAEFESAWYDIPVDLTAYTAQLYSDWNSSLSTTFRINFKDFERGQICRAGPGVGHIEIEDLDEVNTVGTPLEGFVSDAIGDVIGGCDRFRHANEFSDERLQFMAKADYFVGDHVVTGGIEYEDFSLFNLFVQSSRGRYQFDDYQDLVDGAAFVSYQNAPTNVVADGAANWGYNRWTLFLQDTWQITPDFELAFGLRYETFDQSDKPAFSQEVLDAYGVRSDANLDGRDLLLPRVSFRWDLADRTTLTGGFGRFSGGDPKVWTSNAFQPPVVFASEFIPSGVDVTSIPQSLLDEVAAGTALPIDIISEDFEIPSDWKASLRLEQSFLDGYVFTAQYLYTQTEHGFLWQNLPQLALSTGVAPDGRVIYADLQDLSFQGVLPLGGNNLTRLGNHEDGSSHVISLSLGKRYANGVDFLFSYAYQDIEAVTEGTSSRGISNWRGIADVDRNFPSAKTSPYQIEHSFKLNLGYESYWGTNDWRTRFDLFARRLSGDAYMNTFNVSSGNSLFGRASQFESPFDNAPLYIPTGPSDPLVVYASDFDQQGFFDYLGSIGAGAGINGSYDNDSDWYNIWDLRIQQDIPGLPFLRDSLADNNFRIVLDIDNVLNLLNDDWGQFVNGPSFNQNAIVTADLVSVADVAANGVDGATALTGDLPRTTCTAASDCVYRFNDYSDRQVNNVSATQSVYRIRLGIRFDF